MAERRRTAVLISGRGTNLQALIEHCAKPEASAEIALVITDDPAAAGLERARTAGIAAEVVEHREFADRRAFEGEIDARLQAHDVDLVCLAGFMRVLSPGWVERWWNRALNIHPSLLPAFRGLDTHRRALETGARIHGCTVHVVRAKLDAGPIIVQGAVPVHPDDTEDTLAARVLQIEHRCYPLAVELVASGRARVEDECVVTERTTTPDTVIVNPS